MTCIALIAANALPPRIFAIGTAMPYTVIGAYVKGVRSPQPAHPNASQTSANPRIQLEIIDVAATLAPRS